MTGATDDHGAGRNVGRSFSPRRINEILTALGGTRYLEVGVKTGRTFQRVDAAEKVAVDPNFEFDTAAAAAPGITFHEITSDAFFTQHASAVFDVIFLDGLHTFEQTLRDFCASQRHAHRGTIWLIDDTIPSDIFSAHPDQRESRQARRASGGVGAAWHGDVYKVVFAIHDFFPNLSYATINTDGNPQTLVWSMPRAQFSPRFNSLEAISRLDWYALRRHIDVMNQVEEAEGLRRAIAGARAAMGTGTTAEAAG